MINIDTSITSVREQNMLSDEYWDFCSKIINEGECIKEVHLPLNGSRQYTDKQLRQMSPLEYQVDYLIYYSSLSACSMVRAYIFANDKLSDGSYIIKAEPVESFYIDFYQIFEYENKTWMILYDIG